MPLLPLPLALLEELGPLVFMVFWVIYQVYSATRKKDDDAPIERPLPRELPPHEGEPVEAELVVGDQRGAGGAQDELHGEIEEFLDQIGKRKQEPVRPGGARGPIDPFEEPPRRQPPPRRSRVEILVAKPDAPTRSPVAIEPSSPEPPKRVQLSQLSQSHLPESQLAEQAAHLGERIAQADDRVESRLHDKFDHQLGKLAKGDLKRPAQHEAAGVSHAAHIAKLLSDPEGVRDAILLSEILTRPVDRWQD